MLPARVLDAAARLYAADGFDIPHSRIAGAGRISREALRRQVFDRFFTGRWEPEWETLLADRRLPLANRLTRFYTEYRGNITRTGARLWNRAGLLGFHASGNFSATLATRILKPVVRELRHEARLRNAAGRAVMGTELELVQMLHGAIAFPHARAHVYGMDVRGRLPDLVAMMVRVWLPGAVAEIRRVHRRKRSTRP